MEEEDLIGPRVVKNRLFLNHNRYRVQRAYKKSGSAPRIYWKCVRFECKARVVEYPSGKFTEPTVEHTHPPNYDAVKEGLKDVALERLRELTISSPNGSSRLEIIGRLINESSAETLEALPSQKTLVRRVRQYAEDAGVQIQLGRHPYKDFLEEDDDSNSNTEQGPSTLSIPGARRELFSAAKIKKKNKLPKPSSWMKKNKAAPKLRLVDEEGRALDDVSLDRIVTAGEDNSGFRLDYDNLPRLDSAPGATAKSRHDCHREEVTPPEPDDSDDAVDDFNSPADADDGHDFQMDDNLELFGDDVKPTKARTVSTSSKVKRASSKRTQKEIVKSGEKCFVCGDDILISEASSSSQETFRKACCYLNVKSENDWFPRKSNGQFYSFCELCTNEITRIQQLYKNVVEKQSLIFRKVAQLEKLIADSEILDNSLVEGPVSSAKRLEGFRKQVIINYKNKLKLRREVRMGTKLGHDFIEIQPITSAHMFASDPSETSAFRKVSKTGKVCSSSTNNTQMSSAMDPGKPAKRGRGRPRKSQNIEQPLEQKPDINLDSSNLRINSEDVGGDFHDGFDDMPQDAEDDAMSVASEKEIKFWANDPNKLKLYGSDDHDDDNGGNHSDRNVDDSRISNEGSEPDHSNDMKGSTTDDDEEWGPTKTKSRKRKSSTTTKRSGRPSSKSSTPPKSKPPKSEKPRRKYHRHHIEIPDVVLSKEGRMFLSGIEIIKNPPGVFKPRPSELSFSCGACAKVIVSFHAMKGHISGHHLNLFLCPHCGHKSTDGRHLKSHIYTKHTGAPKTPCPICARPISGFSEPVETERRMRFHIYSHFSEEEKRDPKNASYVPSYKKNPSASSSKKTTSYICSYCSKTFLWARSLRRHELVHAGHTFQCQFCGKAFTNGDRFREHNRTCGKPPTVLSQMKYPCLKCPVILKSNRTRILHMRKFHGNSLSLPFTCPHCDKRFAQRGALTLHKNHCTEEQPLAKKKSSSSASSGKGGRRRYRRNNQPEFEEASQQNSISSADGHHQLNTKLETESVSSHATSTYSNDQTHSTTTIYSNNDRTNPSTSSSAFGGGFGYGGFGNYPG